MVWREIRGLGSFHKEASAAGKRRARRKAPKPPARHDCEKAAPPGLLIRMNCKAGERWTCPCGKTWVHVCDEAEGCFWEESNERA